MRSISTAHSEHTASNQHILFWTMILFGAFVIAEIIGALASNSLSLLGDAAAMSIDVITYFENMFAEYLKAKHNGVLSNRTRFLLEVLIPSTSIVALLAVTGWITSDAVGVIKDHGADDDVSVGFLWGYATANMVIDIFCVYLFHDKKKQVFQNIDFKVSLLSEDGNSSANAEPRGYNLNMMSALTHVGGDSMRSLSVFVAAAIATCGYSASLCDAWAAVIVSITIVCMVIPIIWELMKKAQEIAPEEQVDNKRESDVVDFGHIHKGPATAL